MIRHQLYQVTNPGHGRGRAGPFCAGLTADEDGKIKRTAPILQSFRGSWLRALQRVCAQNGWTLKEVP